MMIGHVPRTRSRVMISRKLLEMGILHAARKTTLLMIP